MSNKNYKNYRAESEKAAVEEPAIAEEVAIEETVEVDVPAASERKFGVVTAGELYVRSEPSASAEALGTVKMNQKLELDEDLSNDEFWHVVAESGLEGYCMKSFVEAE